MFKFLNVGKANEEISRLEGELTKAQNELKTANENVTSLTTDGEQLQVKLTTAEGNVTRLNSELTTANGKVTTLTNENAELKNKLANPGPQIAIAASQQAAVISAGQGVPAAIPVKPEAKSEEKVMSRVDFVKLSGGQQSAFCRSGGKLKD